MDGGCTGEENIGKHGYLFEKKMCHTSELDERETYETLALKSRGLACFRMLEPMCVALVD